MGLSGETNRLSQGLFSTRRGHGAHNARAIEIWPYHGEIAGRQPSDTTKGAVAVDKAATIGMLADVDSSHLIRKSIPPDRRNRRAGHIGSRFRRVETEASSAERLQLIGEPSRSVRGAP